MRLFNKIKTALEKKPWIMLSIILLIGLLLRTINLKDNVIFAYDQARDALRIMDMVYNHDIKLVGPETDIPGVFNGVLFYFLLLPIYAVTQFNPNAVALFLVLLNLTMIPLLYYFSTILFKNKYIGYIAGFLWAISFEQINFAKYISNASLMPISSTIFFLGLAVYIFQKKEWGLILSVIGLATSIHFNFYLLYLIVFYPVVFLIYQPRLKLRTVFLSILFLLIILSPFMIAELKWDFPTVKSLSAYFLKHVQPGNEKFNVLNVFRKYYERISEMSYFSFFSFQRDLGTLLMYAFSFLAILSAKNNKKIFLIICLFSTFPLFIFNSGVLTVQVINSSIFYIFTLTFASGIYLSGNKHKIWIFIVLGVIFISNFNLFKKDNFKINTLFASHPLTYGLEKNAVDYMYQSSNKTPYSFCSVSNPLFFNTIWSFMFKTYGEKKYGYVPFWTGQKQFMNKNYLKDDITHINKRYLLIEPMVGIPDFAKTATIYLEDKRSRLLSETYFDQFIVQKRSLYTKENTAFTDTQKLSLNEIKSIEMVTNAEPRYYCYIGY